MERKPVRQRPAFFLRYWQYYLRLIDCLPSLTAMASREPEEPAEDHEASEDTLDGRHHIIWQRRARYAATYLEGTSTSFVRTTEALERDIRIRRDAEAVQSSIANMAAKYVEVMGFCDSIPDNFIFPLQFSRSSLESSEVDGVKYAIRAIATYSNAASEFHGLVRLHIIDVPLLFASYLKHDNPVFRNDKSTKYSRILSEHDPTRRLRC